MLRLIYLLVFSAVAAGVASGRPFEPSGILLTWQRDPATTMTIDWHSIDGPGVELVSTLSVGHNLPVLNPVPARVRQAILEFRRLGETRWETASGWNRPFPFKEDREGSLHRDGYSHSFPASARTIHRVELTGLMPDTYYEFRFDAEGSLHRFRTMPREMTREIRFASGGDIGYGHWTEHMNRIAVSHDPDFVLWGGDLAYCDGLQERLGRWYGFFDSLTKSLVTPEGRRIPVLVTVGNHEVRGGYHDRIERVTDKPYLYDDAGRLRAAPYFMSFFAMPGHPGYNVLDFGNYLSILMLDSGHLNPVEGTQTRWLDETLAKRTQVPHVFPSYHVPAFATFRTMNERPGSIIRENWVPLFEKHRLSVVFENHDHNYKRTFPIRELEPHPEGVVYLGDGAWTGWVVGIRHPEDKWFLERAEPVNHFIMVRLNGPEAQFEAINIRGDVIDRYRAKRR